MKKIKLMENKNRLFIIALAIALIAAAIIFIVKPVRGIEFSGAYRFSYQYTNPLAEGEIDPSVGLTIDGSPMNPDPDVLALDMAAVKEVLTNIGIPFDSIMNDPGETYAEESFMTVIVSSVKTNEPIAMQEEIFGALIDGFVEYNISPIATTSVAPIFNWNFLIKVAITVVVGFLLLLLVLGFGLSEIGGIGVAFVVAVLGFFVEIITMASFFILRIPIGSNFIWVSAAAVFFALFVGILAFTKLQNDYNTITEKNLVDAIDNTGESFLSQGKFAGIILIALGIATMIAVLAFGYSLSFMNIIPMIISIIASYYGTVFFALPFWGSSLYFESETTAKKSVKKSTPKKEAAKQQTKKSAVNNNSKSKRKSDKK